MTKPRAPKDAFEAHAMWQPREEGMLPGADVAVPDEEKPKPAPGEADAQR